MEDKKYFFRPDKKFLKQGFYMEDENKKIIYEAKMTKWSLFGAMKFDFINHVSNKSSEHDVGKTITSEESGLFEAFSTNSRFKFDKKNNRLFQVADFLTYIDKTYYKLIII